MITERMRWLIQDAISLLLGNGLGRTDYGKRCEETASALSDAILTNDARMVKEFESLHKQDSEKYGWVWLRLNEHIVHAAAECGVDYSGTEAKWLLTKIAHRVIVNLEQLK